MTKPDETRIQAALEQLEKEDLQALILRMVQQHPDLAGLIVSGEKKAVKKPRKPFNAEVYRLQVEKIFLTTDRDRWGSEARAAEPLLDIVDVADEYVEQGDFNEAAIIYEIVIKGILDNYDSFRWHADEGQLDEVVEDCVNGLSDCLRGMQQETAACKKILKTLFDVYDLDMSLENEMPVMSSKVPAILVRYTTPEERRMVAKWVRKGFDLVDIDWSTYEVEEYAQSFEVLLLGLEGDDLEDEAFLRLSREMESYEYIVDRLLKRGRLQEALAEAKQVDDFDILGIADILSEHGYEDQAVQLIKKRVDQSSRPDLLHWLQERYEAGGNPEAALEIAKRTFTTNFHEATIERYREIRELAQPPGRWDEVRAELLAYVQRERLTSVEIEIALDEGRVDLALELLEAGKQTTDTRNGPYGSGNFDVGLEVAKAAEEKYPLKAIEIYQRYVDMRIEWRGRDNYRIASQYLLSIRRLYQQMGKSNEWAVYIANLRQRHANLPALRDEMAKAKV